MDTYKRSIRGLQSRSNGEHFEGMIIAASRFYEERGIAAVDKTPEVEKLWKILRETKWDCKDKELESHEEKYILHYCISLMQELVGCFEEWYRWVHGENAIKELSEEERFCYNMSYFHIVQELFLFRTYHSGGTSTMAKCKQLGVDSSENVEFKFEEGEEGE